MNKEQEKRAAHADISRAQQADELIRHPLYQEAIISIKGDLLMQFEDTKLRDDELRHELWQRMQLLKEFTGKFEDILRRGEKAREKLTMLERAKNFVRI